MVTIRLELGDLTRTGADALVNAANSGLLGGGGVDGALHRAGGPSILAECRALRAGPLRDGLPTGQALATTAGELAARWLIHVVGPVYAAGREAELRPLLASCYTEALRVADEVHAATVAAPAVSAGAYGWPLADAAQTAVGAVAAGTTHVQQWTFVLASREVLAAFQAALDQLEGPH